ncbi:unnamed protein product [Didymodactylos carnosus]|uniref:CCHC-type domain-containing protein n=1 Tax=Didymodactylos carnosus TaxID=1234261 RepID=A0A815WD37_9BILA|nr:unnamed protein product [Didymodactylos carnosus]CAF4402826.1 unnamed protein product [Didymodactylos carnosus]
MSKPSLPPQLSLIIKNVDLRVGFSELSTDLQANYPSVKNVIRMKNKFQNEIRLVKIELLSTQDRNQLLARGKIMINHISYDVVEYLAPANVLICSKCMGLGHFKKQCKETTETCKVCRLACQDLKNHQCTQQAKCLHCGGNHNSNALSCPVVKQFRADLTKKLLSNINSYVQPKLVQQPINNNSNYMQYLANFPPLPLSHYTPVTNPNSVIIQKLDELNNNMMKINNRIGELVRKTDKLEKFMVEKIESDTENLKRIQMTEMISEANKRDISSLLDTVHYMAQFLLKLNVDQNGRTNDANFKYNLERHCTQLAKCVEKKGNPKK